MKLKSGDKVRSKYEFGKAGLTQLVLTIVSLSNQHSNCFIVRPILGSRLGEFHTDNLIKLREVPESAGKWAKVFDLPFFTADYKFYIEET